MVEADRTKDIVRRAPIEPGDDEIEAGFDFAGKLGSFRKHADQFCVGEVLPIRHPEADLGGLEL